DAEPGKKEVMDEPASEKTKISIKSKAKKTLAPDVIESKVPDSVVTESNEKAETQKESPKEASAEKTESKKVAPKELPADDSHEERRVGKERRTREGTTTYNDNDDAR